MEEEKMKQPGRMIVPAQEESKQKELYQKFHAAVDEMLLQLTVRGERDIVRVVKLHSSCVVVEFDKPKGDKYKIKITKDFDKVTLD